MTTGQIGTVVERNRRVARGGAREALAELLAKANVRLDGKAPTDIRTLDDRLPTRLLAGGSLALGESYVDGWWECDDLEALFYRLLSTDLPQRIRTWRMASQVAGAKLVDRARRSRAFQIGERHYDLGNELFEAMLDRRMIYSCGYWKDARTLDEAQEAKLDLVCRKLRLRDGMRVLDVGCGWGGFARFAAERFGARVVGITVSRRQLERGKELTAGLPVELRLEDYRDEKGTYDAIVSIGMFEHVGHHNHRRFFETMRRCLAARGLMLLHTIGGRLSQVRGDPWIDTYIFPNSLIPSARQIAAAVEGLFVVEDWHPFGADYHPTLMSWHRNFEAAWSRLHARYGERFRRMWRYYLLSCAGGFRARYNDVWQIVLSPRGVEGGYQVVR